MIVNVAEKCSSEILNHIHHHRLSLNVCVVIHVQRYVLVINVKLNAV